MIRAIRGMKVVFLFAFFGVCALIERYLVFPFQKTQKEHYDTLFKSWKWFVGVLIKTKVINLNIDDIKKIENIRNSIIVSTHPSFIDVLILMSIIPYTTCFVAQKLAKNPFFKGMVELLFILDAENWPDKACEKMDEGLNILIFPMGSRHKKDEQPKIRRGASLIAQKTGNNIVALNIETDINFLASKQPIYDAGDKTVQYKIEYLGEIDTSEYLKKYTDEVDFKTEVTKKIKEILYKYKN